MSSETAPGALARTALAAADAAAPGTAWLVGGAVRDVLLGTLNPLDLDLAVQGDPAPVAKAVSRAIGAPLFALSDRFGGYRVTAATGLQVDVMPLAPEGLVGDLRRRDLTVNALAVPLNALGNWPSFDRSEVVDETGGLRDLEQRTLRACGPASMLDDPLRVLRVARAVAGGRWRLDGATVQLAREAAPGLAKVAGERIGAEIRGTLAGSAPLDGLAALSRVGGTDAVLPEVAALDGVTQSKYHHLDVGGHTREVLDYTVQLESRLAAYVDPAQAAWFARRLDDEVGGGWSVRETMRFGALLHDIAKPQTRVYDAARGSIGFPGHDRAGERLAGQMLERLRVPRKVVRAVQSLTLNHLRLGFLVHARPLGRVEIYDYLRRCEPMEVEVTVLALADRLATRGRRAEEAIELHADLTRELLPHAIAWREAGGAPAALLDGDVLMREIGAPGGPWLADALEAQRRARFVDPALTAAQALAVARSAADGR
ncbi:MAG: HD domain-containing protein [Solirubrobacteraceae bacterium]|nr:HD domain-containing protein [Solirubrobacteraceae bacterium]